MTPEQINAMCNEFHTTIMNLSQRLAMVSAENARLSKELAQKTETIERKKKRGEKKDG